MNHLIVGFGSIGKRHYNNLINLGLASDPDILVYDPLSEHPRVDTDCLNPTSIKDSVVYICSPTEKHRAQFRYICSNSPRAIFVEKPLCLAEERPFFPKSDIPVALGYCYRFHPVIQTIRANRKNIKHLKFNARDGLSDRYGFTALETMGSHSIDAALWIAGPATHSSVIDYGHRAEIYLWHELGVKSEIYVDISDGRRASECIVTTNDDRLHGYNIGPDETMYHREISEFAHYVNSGNPGHLCCLEEAIWVQDIMRERVRVA